MKRERDVKSKLSLWAIPLPLRDHPKELKDCLFCRQSKGNEENYQDGNDADEEVGESFYFSSPRCCQSWILLVKFNGHNEALRQLIFNGSSQSPVSNFVVESFEAGRLARICLNQEIVIYLIAAAAAANEVFARELAA